MGTSKKRQKQFRKDKQASKQASMAKSGKGLLLIVLLGLASPALAGFRCTLGEWACTASCVTLGQTSGLCTDEGECQCSERSISLNNLLALLPSRCHLGASFCAATCNSIGQKNGTCVEKDSGETDCQCGGYLSPTEFALCAAESTCRLDSRDKGLAAGSALVGLASANPTRTPPSPQSLRTSLPTRSNWNNKFPCNTLSLSRKVFSF